MFGGINTKSSNPGFGLSFGAPTTGSITFGTPAVPNPTPFGAPSQPASGFGSTNFGMPSFGTPAPATTQSTGLSFGTPATGGTGFPFGAAPASTASTTGLTFGTPSTLPTSTTSFGFGTTAPGTTSLNFGTPATSTTTGFSFGTPASTNLTFGTPASTTGLTFGTPASTGLTFGTPASTGLAFGTPATTNLAFGTPTSSSLSFGTAPITTSAPSFAFNTTSTQPALPAMPFAAPFALNTQTTTSAPSFNSSFGGITTTTSTFSLTTPSTTNTTGLSFGLGAATTQTSGLSFGLGGTTTSLSLSKPLTTTSAQPTFGLGGIVQSTPKTEALAARKPEIAPCDQLIPNELQQTVENFKAHVKQQNSFSSDVSRISVKEFRKVSGEVDQVGNALTEVEKQLQNNRSMAEKLKIDTAKGLQNIEMAQRTMDTPPNLQYDNVMPMVFFKELVDNFEKELQNLKLQIEYTDKYIRNFDKPLPLNSQDLAVGMRRLHETFVALAGRLQTVHNQVESQKEQYLNFRKYMRNDDTNIFETPKAQSNISNITFSSFNYKPPSIASGPSPFNALSHPSVIQAAAQNQTQTTTAGNISFGFCLQPTNPTGTSVSGNTCLVTHCGQPSSLQFNTAANTNFQLQKPPTGNKRGKQITY